MSLDLLKKALKDKKQSYKADYFIPKLWLEPELGQSSEIINVNPCDFILNRIDEIERLAKSENREKIGDKSAWTKSANIYNLFVRLFSAFDHNQNGKIDLGGNLRETGTFAKAIALLPYIHSLGVNTIYLLPITSIGIDQKKGSLGSPYATKNHYKIEDTLSEPFLEMGAEAEFLAFTSAVKALNMKLVIEFVFRTSSVDSDKALERPDWFYWLKDNVKNREHGSENPRRYGPPIFAEKTLANLRAKINDNDFSSLPSPLRAFKNLFDVPNANMPKLEDNRIIAKNAQSEKLRIASAFADWPPDDNQPVWSDVTYLKLYNSPKFDYIAYNTVRMYDSELAQEKNINQDLWNYLENILPHFIDAFDIDGVMIDMGHALPNDLRASILENARAKKSDFAFWEENFTLSEESRKNGYDAVLGYLPFDSIDVNKVKGLIWRLSNEKTPIDFFSTSETHNVRRTASVTQDARYSKMIYTLAAFLPALPFIHSGFELCETKPVNTGLCFTDDEIAQFPPDKLALFSESSLDWTNETTIVDFIRQVQKIRREELFSELSDNIDCEFIETYNSALAAFKRRSIRGEYDIMVVINYSENGETLYYEDNNLKSLIDLVDGNENFAEWNKISLCMDGYAGKVFRLTRY